jgi:hypothetical protein
LVISILQNNLKSGNDEWKIKKRKEYKEPGTKSQKAKKNQKSNLKKRIRNSDTLFPATCNM